MRYTHNRIWRGRGIVHEAAARELPVLSFWLGAFLVVFACVDAAVNEESERVWRLLVSLVPGLVLLALFVVSRARRMPAVAAPWLMAAGILSVCVGQMVTVYCSRAASDLALYLMIWSATGAAALGTAPFVTVTAALLAGWVYSARLVVPGEGWLLAGDWTGAVLATLATSIAIHVGRASNFKNLERIYDELAQLARMDSLTGVASRYGANVAFRSLRADAIRQRALLFAVFVDVDGLKRTNDVFGHDAGDALIVAAGRAITASTRGLDIVARWGGDEYVVVGAGDAPDLRRLRGAIELHLNAAVQERGLPLSSVSLGVSTSSPERVDIDTLVNAADADMYRRRHEHRSALRLLNEPRREAARA